MRIKPFSGKLCLLYVAVVLASCEDYYGDTAADNRIVFSVSESDNPLHKSAEASHTGTASIAQNTRATAYKATENSLIENSSEHLTVRRFEGGSSETHLYLHSLVEDRISTNNSSGQRLGNTRATPATQANFHSLYGEFQMLAYRHDGSWATHTSSEEYMNESISTTSNLEGVSTKEWPCYGGRMSFFAYAPVSIKHNGENCLTVLSSADDGATLHYEVPNDVSAQKDILAAMTPDVSDGSKSAVGLTFYHALTAVRFVADAGIKAGEITRITLKNVYGRANHVIGSDLWTDYAGKTDYTLSENISIAAGNGTMQQSVTSETQTFMMLPQTFGSDASAAMEVAYSDGTATRTLTASLANTSWKMGTTVTYRISPSNIFVEPTLTVEASQSNPNSLTSAGGDMQYSVTSYATIATEGGTVASYPVDWTAQYSTDGTTWSDTLALVASTRNRTANTTQDISQYTVSLAMAAQDIVSSNTRSFGLQNATAKGSTDAPYNLASSSGDAATVENTANCYVVDAPGTYCIPLVYGNAIKNAADNQAAYRASGSGKNVLTNFVDYHGNSIVSPWMTGYDNAVVVWNDAGIKSFIQVEHSIRTLNHRPYLVFTVPREYMRQGNAVVAVRDADNAIMWSWHIWMTDALAAQPIATTNHNGLTYEIMPQNLGFCYGESLGWTSPSRTVYVKLTQKTDVAYGIALSLPCEHIIAISQDGASGTTLLADNAPFYQWGRKDPFAAGAGKGIYQTVDGEKSFYTTYPNWQYRSMSAVLNNMTVNLNYDTDNIPTIAATIQKPMTLYRSINRYNGSSYYLNLWSAQYTAAETFAPETVAQPEVLKTIYDPCPVGYCIPPIGAFNGFVTNNANAYKTGTAALSLARGLEYADSENNGINGYNKLDSYVWHFYGNGLAEADFYTLGVRGITSNTNHFGWGVVQYFRQYDMTNALICHWYAGWMTNGASDPNPAFMRITRNTGANNPYAYCRTVEIVACSQFGIDAYPIRPVREQN